MDQISPTQVLKIERQVKRAMIKGLVIEPFVAPRAVSLRPIVCRSVDGRPVPTLAVSGTRLYINPECWDGMTRDQQVTVFMHETWHVALGHHLRRGKRDHYYWNIACDLLINLLLIEDKFKPIDGWLYDIGYKGWAEERIYEDVVKHKDDYPPPPALSGDEDGDSQASSGSDGPPNKSKPIIGEVWDGELEDGTAMSGKEKKEELTRIKEELSMSKVINGMQDDMNKKSGSSSTTDRIRTVDTLLNVNASWSSQLESYFAKIGQTAGYAWHALDRRGMQMGIYRPAELKQSIGWMVFLWDVSISMDYDAHIALLSSIESIRETSYIKRITMVPFNSEVQVDDIIDVYVGDDIPTEYNTGGGTRFQSGFDWVRSNEELPDGIIIFTDLCDENYGPEPEVPVVWMSSQPPVDLPGSCMRTPPWGELIVIDTWN